MLTRNGIRYNKRRQMFFFFKLFFKCLFSTVILTSKKNYK